MEHRRTSHESSNGDLSTAHNATCAFVSSGDSADGLVVGAVGMCVGVVVVGVFALIYMRAMGFVNSI